MNPATERHPGPAAETVCPDCAAAMRAPGDLGRAEREPQVDEGNRSDTSEARNFADLLCLPKVKNSAHACVVSLGSATLEGVAVKALPAARRHAAIITPYFVPDEAPLVALRLAVVRGDRLDLIVPARSDQLLVGLAGQPSDGTASPLDAIRQDGRMVSGHRLRTSRSASAPSSAPWPGARRGRPATD